MLFSECQVVACVTEEMNTFYTNMLTGKFIIKIYFQFAIHCGRDLPSSESR
jgi:hypothetical protein